MASDNSFLDLRAGGRLKVVVPVFNSGHDRMIFSPGQAKDGSITLSAAGLAGYQSSYYATMGSADGTVRLPFQSAETAIDGVKTSMAKAPELPFALPAKRQHLRLLYLVRQSRSDHNMAIVGSKHLALLNSFTLRVKSDPNLCTTDGEIFCSWVPAGIAVRAE